MVTEGEQIPWRSGIGLAQDEQQRRGNGRENKEIIQKKGREKGRGGGSPRAMALGKPHA